MDVTRSRVFGLMLRTHLVRKQIRCRIPRLALMLLKQVNQAKELLQPGDGEKSYPEWLVGSSLNRMSGLPNKAMIVPTAPSPSEDNRSGKSRFIRRTVRCRSVSIQAFARFSACRAPPAVHGELTLQHRPSRPMFDCTPGKSSLHANN